jgi:hypothetical protein
MNARLAVALTSIISALVLGISVHQTTEAGREAENEDHERVQVTNNVSCGVERWSIKTGTDAQAHKVNTAKVYPTNVFHLIHLPASGDPSPFSRSAPVEYTTWQVTATLVRIKLESDSDFHLVLSDAGGRTMIAEAPFPGCVGTSSPFAPQIRTVRAKLVSLYHPSSSHWTYPNQQVTVRGVGFFDFKHGQSGVAPNAIELHPLLAFNTGGSTKLPTAGPQPPAPPSKPTPRPAGGSSGFSVRVSVSPNSMSHNTQATLTVHTSPGATCTASVVYSTGRSPVSFDPSAHLVPSSGTSSWTWHEETSGTGGTATAQCRYRGQTKSASAGFTVS